MSRAEPRVPKVVAISNESPDWTPLDIQYADETWHLLLDALSSAGYEVRAFKFHDDLAFLDEFDPREWLVWNFGEELAGRPWSEAEVAEEIERRGLAYTGSPPQVLRQTQNRAWTKEHLRLANVSTLPWCVCRSPADAGAWETFPAIVKGLNQHASVGLDRESVVFTRDELERRITYLREQHDDNALVEPFLDSREFQVAVIGNDPPVALPPSEISFAAFDDPRDRVHTQQWKVDRGSRGYREIRMLCPEPLDRADWRARLEALAVEGFKALGIRDYARFDLRMSGDDPMVLDVNANPELDPESVVIAGARASGMTYADLVTRITGLAARRMPT